MNSRHPRLLVAISGHGFGHATRTAEVARELVFLRPNLELTISSTSPRRLFEHPASSQISHRSQAYEPGTIQKNCFEVDLKATCEAYERYQRERSLHLEAEVQFLRDGEYSGVLADIPAVAIEAASRAGVPSAAMWNFTWDWILEPIISSEHGASASLSELVLQMRSAYSGAGLHLKLPFSPVKTPFPGVEPAPLVGRRSSVPREVTLRKVGMNPLDKRPIVLVAMGGWDCGHWPPIIVKGCKDFRFLVVGDVPLETQAQTQALPASLAPGYKFFDLVRAADVVLSKPGYGIASECVVNRTPLLGVERGGFREIPELLRDLSDFGPFAEISMANFFAGQWEDSLYSVLTSTTAWKPTEYDGALRVAHRLCEFYGI